MLIYWGSYVAGPVVRGPEHSLSGITMAGK